MKLTTQQYRRLRRVYLRTARAYRLGSVWGPANAAELRKQQCALAAIRKAWACSNFRN